MRVGKLVDTTVEKMADGWVGLMEEMTVVHLADTLAVWMGREMALMMVERAVDSMVDWTAAYMVFSTAARTVDGWVAKKAVWRVERLVGMTAFERVV
jgi:hypothetical protein